MKEIRRISLAFLTHFFFILVLLLFGSCAIYLFYQAFWADYDYVRIMAEQDNLRQLKNIETGVEKRLTEVAQELSQKCIFATSEQILDYQLNDRQKNEELNRQYLTEAEFSLYKIRHEAILKSGKGEIAWPLRLHIFSLSLDGFQEIEKYLENAFACTGEDMELHGSSYRLADYPVMQEICRQGLRIRADQKTRTFLSTQADFRAFQDILAENPVYRSQLESIFVQIFRFASTNIIWSNPADDLTERKLCHYRDSFVEFKARGHMIWSVLFAFRSSGKLGELPDKLMDLVRKAFSFDLVSDKWRHRPYLFNKRTLVWDLWPQDYNEDDRESEEVLLFPQNVIVGEINNDLLVRSVLLQKSGDFFTSPGKLILRLKNKGEAITEYALLHSKDQPESIIEPTLLHSKAQSEPVFITNLELLPSWYVNTDFFYGQPGVPYHTEKELAGTGKLLVTAYRPAFLEDAQLVFYQPIANFSIPFYRRWLFLLSCLLLSFLFYHRRLHNCLRSLEKSMNACLFSVLHDEDEELAKGNSGDEIRLLRYQLAFFRTQIARRFNFFELTRKLHNVLNIPRRNFRHYFDEFYYLSADISSDYRWKLLDSDCDSFRSGSGFKLELHLSETELEYVRQKMSLKGFPLLVFNEELSAQEQLAFQGYFSLLVQKSRLEEEGAVTEQLRADRHLGLELQRYIEPSPADLCLDGLSISFQLRRAGAMSYDFGGALSNGREMTVYFVDLWENGLRAALIANSFKPYIDSVLEHHDPLLIMNQANEFACSGHFDGLFAGMVCLSINSLSGEFRCICAGYPPLIRLSAQKPQILNRAFPPLGVTMEQSFTVFKAQIEAGVKIGLFSDGLFRLIFTDIINFNKTATIWPERVAEFMGDNYVPEDDLLFFSFTKA